MATTVESTVVPPTAPSPKANPWVNWAVGFFAFWMLTRTYLRDTQPAKR